MTFPRALQGARSVHPKHLHYNRQMDRVVRSLHAEASHAYTCAHMMEVRNLATVL